jgi:branched-chain amino acid transport system permease protein
MLYREAGQFRTSYAQDSQIFPLRQDRVGIIIMLIAAMMLPFVANSYWLSAILIPWLVLSLVALGQNILMGYAGQLSLGSAGFMAVGAFACYNLILRIDGIPFVVAVGLSGVCAALVGIVFGLPSLRIRGLYLAVATLASQFFIVWALDKFGWFKNYDPAGVITAQPIVMFGHNFATPREKYWVVLAIVAVLALLAKNMARGSIGRGWMAVRDMDVAAEVMGCSRSPICRPWSRRPSASICRSEFSSWSSSVASAPSWARSWARASSC